MPNYAYDRLNFLDHSFLRLESQTQPMHVAGVGIYEAGPLRKPDGGIDADRIRDYIESRLSLIPRYRQVLAFTPVEGRPVWVDDAHFNIHYHVRHTALPRPGDERQLKRIAGRIMEHKLDRSRPLWEVWIIEGCEDPDRFAMIVKVHHAVVDGISGVDVLSVLLKPEPEVEFERPRTWLPRPAPSGVELAWAETKRRVSAPIKSVMHVKKAIRRAQDPRSDLQTLARAAAGSLSRMLRPVSSTPLNQPIGPHRRFDWMAMPLADVKEVRRALGGSVNDVVLATVNGAVRRFLESRRVNVDTLDFRVMAPVSMRAAHERGTLGNHVAAWMIDLPLAERDPARAVARVREQTERLKASKDAMGAAVLTKVVSWSPSTLLTVGARLMTRAYPFNLVVTNVPGPQQPLYLLGARMLANYGLVPLTDYLAMGIVIFSYDGTLSWGFNADWDLLPDLHDIVLGTGEAFRDLQRAARPADLQTASLA